MRSDDFFNQLWEKAKILAASVDADSPKVPKFRKMSRRLDERSSNHYFDQPESYYRSIFFQTVDSVIGHIEKRIEEKGTKIMASIESLIKCAWCSDPLLTEENEDFLRVIDHFGTDLEKSSYSRN